MIKVVKTTNSRVHRITILSINIFWSAEEILKANQKKQKHQQQPTLLPDTDKKYESRKQYQFSLCC